MFKRLNRSIKNMKRYHVGAVKWSVLGFTLMIAKLWDGILYLDWYWYLVIGVVFMIPSLCVMFSKKSMKGK